MSKKIVIILGKKLKSEIINPELRGRMETGIAVFRKQQADLLMLSGGATNPDIPWTESELMRDYAIQRGIDTDCIMMELHSKDTIGNGFFTRELIDKIYSTMNIFVVSSCYHMERVRYIFFQCYDNNFLLNFNYCFPYRGNIPHEKKSLEKAELFFNHIERGNIVEIRKKLFKEHDLYIQ